RYLQPAPGNVESNGQASDSGLQASAGSLPVAEVRSPKPEASTGNGPAPTRIEEETDRRWYPVIDFSRCTNCLECLDFCLFGVYGIGQAETILVEQPDNCRKGCPACSRVCPANAIIFPQRDTSTEKSEPPFAFRVHCGLTASAGYAGSWQLMHKRENVSGVSLS
ncbi:MAG: hypothetical protein L0312_06120, partial [Acidobacteria bacterium]|nr:hypothetical protein [Acidobacteriota bacterium]